MIVQGSEQWFALRLGRVTSSRVADVLSKGKGLTRNAYRDELVAERLSGQPCAPTFESEAMKRGTAEEPFSRSAYEAHAGVLVDECAFVEHPRLFAGASPDGLVGLDGAIEMKNPNSSTHCGYLEGGVVPSKYVPQMMWLMACSGRAWVDFVSFDSRLPEPARLFVKRLPRDDAWIKATEAEVEKFLAEVDAIVARYTL